MSCDMASELLPELLSGTLDGEREAEVLRHVAGCPGCRHELAFWAQVAAAMQEEARPMPAGLHRQLRNELFGTGVKSAWESLRLAGQALGLAGHACRLAYAAVAK